ncbi:GNAT family N-acetyltransferase [Roseiarcus fermentans]|nr:GNAT family N-acetyltransferase [Roseiarcus fermentans]
MVAACSGLDGFPKPETQPDTYRTLANVGEQTETPGARLLVALDGDRLAGAVVLTADIAAHGSGATAATQPDAAGFRFLAVDPEFRGRGLAKALVERCVDLARAQGCARLVIHATDAMKAARAICVARGFERAPDLDFVDGWTPAYGFRLPL